MTESIQHYHPLKIHYINYESSWQDYVDGSWATKGELPGIFDTEYGRVGIGALVSDGVNGVQWCWHSYGIAMVEWPLNLDRSRWFTYWNCDFPYRYVKVLEVFFLSLSHMQMYIIYNYIYNNHVNVVFALTIIGGMMIPTYYSYYEKGLNPPKRPLMAPCSFWVWIILDSLVVWP